MNEVSLWQAGLYSYVQSEILKIYTDVVKKNYIFETQVRYCI